MPGGRFTKIAKGDKFGRLTVLQVRPWKVGRPNVLCVCSCGKNHEVYSDSLKKSGDKASCGCWVREKLRERGGRISRTHGLSQTVEGRSWGSMINRCYNKKQQCYRNYGAKGVIVCVFLRESPINLLALLGHSTEERCSLDRFPDHVGNYTCGKCKECKEEGWSLNVRWATRKEQNRNRGNYNCMITAFGETLTKSEWMERSGLSWDCLTRRLRNGWDSEKALATPDVNGNCFQLG
jgi:hypothetical protein